jgi:glucose-1-phosphate thymidylyltransferase
VQVIEQRQGIKIACIEEIAYRKKFITKEQVKKIAQPLLKSGYGQYLLDLINS